MKKWRNKITGEINEFMVHKRIEDSEDGNPVYAPFDGCIDEWEDYEEPKEYWWFDYGGRIKAMNDSDNEEDKARKAIGNYFETKEEAEKAVERLRAWKRLKDKGLEVTEWSHGLYLDKTIVGRFRYEFPIDKKEDIEKDLDLLLFRELNNEI